MVEPVRVLRPFEEERAAIETLTAYRSETELQDAIERTGEAVDRVLRLLLRSDAGSPDTVRMAALSPEQLDRDALIAALRRRDLISLELAGLVHGLDQAVERATSGQVRPADADAALRVVRRLTLEVAGETDETRERAASPGKVPEPVATEGNALPATTDSSRAALMAVGAIVLMLAVAAVLWLRRGGDIVRAEEAFGAGRLDEAEVIFRASADAGTRDAGVWLYLGRIYRRQGRAEDAANALRTAAELDPADADVRRELGYLFLDLGRPESAVTQFRRAQELAPDDPLGWLGLIHALRVAGDPEADAVLARAPEEVQTRFAAGRTTTTRE